MITHIDPPGLAPIPAATHATVATGTRIIHVSGQTGVDADGAAVGTTHVEQSAQAFRNLRTVIEAAGATLADTTSITIYVAQLDDGVFEAVVDGAFGALGDDSPLTAATLVGVTALWRPDLLVEVSATLLLD